MQSTENKWVYLFSEGNAQMRSLLGGKGANLCEMTNIGLPVPPGFVITTEACNAYLAAGETLPPGLWEQVIEALSQVEAQMDKRFGDADNPLLVSVRSGAAVSMPGMMDTVLNLGLNDDTVRGLAASADGRFAYDTYRRFVQGFGSIVLGIDSAAFEEIITEYKQEVGKTLDIELSAEEWQDVRARFLALIEAETGAPMPTDPYEQLRRATEAVFNSWFGQRAVEYRSFHGIPHDLGTAVNIVSMVYGNMGLDSGTGVAFTRNPATGEKALYGEYLINAQGEDVVAGVRTPETLDQLAQEMPQIHRQFAETATLLEDHYRDAQDIEFTIERGKLYILQTRTGKRTPRAAVNMAVDMAEEGLISKEEAVLRVEADQIPQLFVPVFEEEGKQEARSQGQYLAQGLAASPGAATGIAIFDAHRADERANNGERVILVRPETSPDDIAGILAAEGILTARGGLTSHAAVVARGLGKPCVAGCSALAVDVEARNMTVNGRVIAEGDVLSVDGTTGEVFAGALSASTPNVEETELASLLRWADGIRRLGVRANADTPLDARVAVDMGAEGIGLCRTEHMFLLPERLALVRSAILNAPRAIALEALPPEQVEDPSPINTYHESLRGLEQLQVDDFRGIFEVMEDRPVIIRLLDPPLHEFLPAYGDLRAEVTELRLVGNDPARLAEQEDLLRAVEVMKEANPMLGLRGCRLGIVYSAIYEMQVRAIMRAACSMVQEGKPVHPEVMIPLVAHARELELLKDSLQKISKQVQYEMGVEVRCEFGTMIEVPRAALTADEVAEFAEFFSFGTNDLTQMTFGFSRDDAEGKFLGPYVDQHILPQNPFEVLDVGGVGKLVEMAITLGRKARPGLEVGICGEHGGEPQSIQFCHQVGMDYVSCSPYRVPVARLAAAQAALGGPGERDL